MNDIKPFVHGEEGTHFACNEMAEQMGSKVTCCGCNGHGCKESILVHQDTPEKLVTGTSQYASGSKSKGSAFNPKIIEKAKRGARKETLTPDYQFFRKPGKPLSNPSGEKLDKETTVTPELDKPKDEPKDWEEELDEKANLDWFHMATEEGFTNLIKMHFYSQVKEFIRNLIQVERKKIIEEIEIIFVNNTLEPQIQNEFRRIKKKYL